MKELSIEEKAKRYDEAIEIVKSKIKNDKDHVLYEDDFIEIFPELAESEEEKIRKALIKLVKKAGEGYENISEGISIQKAISWLEQQRSKDNAEDVDILHRFSFYSYKDEPNVLYLAGLYVNEEYRNKGIGTKILEVADEVAKSLNCFAIRLETKKDSNAERLYQTHGYNRLATEGDDIWLEKQGEQKSIDEIAKDVGKDKTSAVDFLKKAGIMNENGELAEQYRQCEQKPVNIDYISGIRKELLSIEDNAENINGLTESQWVAIRATHRLLGECITKEQESSWSEEDERFLNIAINLFNSSKVYTKSPDKYEDTINWLKSLKDRVQSQPRQEWSEEDDDDAWLNDIISKVESNLQLNKDEIDWLKSIRNRVLPQPKQEWSIEDEAIIEVIIQNLELLNDEDDYYRKHIDFLKSLKDRVHPKREWSEDDSVMIDNILGTYKTLEDMLDLTTSQDKDILENMNFERDWIKSLKYRIQQKQEWSEEDEKVLDKMRDYFMRFLGRNPDFTDDKRYEGFVEFIDHRLKVIRPQNTWMPSDEQMDALNLAIGEANSVDTAEGDEAAGILTSLFEQLKKLREE